MKISESNISGSLVCPNVPEESGVYLVTDSCENVLYVGSSNNLRRRIAYLFAHVYDSSSGGYTHNASDPLIKLQIEGEELSISYIVCDDYKKTERKLISKYQPSWNKKKA